MKLPTLPPDDPSQAGSPAFDALLAVQLRTPDLERSLRFWSGLLGLKIAKTESAPLRRYFLELGAGFLVLEESAAPPQSPHVSRVSLSVKDVEALDALRRRLLAAGTPVTGLEDEGHQIAFRFRDRVTGLQLQAAARTRTLAPDDRFGDAQLVPFAAEQLKR